MRKKALIIFTLVILLSAITWLSPGLTTGLNLNYELNMSDLTPDMINEKMYELQKRDKITEIDVVLLCEFGHQLLITDCISARTYYGYVKAYMDEDVFLKLNTVYRMDTIKNFQQRFYKSGISVQKIQYSDLTSSNGYGRVTVKRQYNDHTQFVTYVFDSSQEKPVIINVAK